MSEATEKFRQALRLNPLDGKARYNLAVSLLLQNQLDEAVDEFHAYLLSVPDDPDAHYYLGLALLAKGNRLDPAASFTGTPASEDVNFSAGNLARLAPPSDGQ